MNTYISLSSLSMDLKRVALGYNRGSISMAERFWEEVLKRRGEIDPQTVKPYIRNLLNSLENIKKQDDIKKIAEDTLMYSTLFQNAALNQTQA